MAGAMSVIDFSRWNTLPWWKRNGYRSLEEAWADYSRCQTIFMNGPAAKPSADTKSHETGAAP